MPSYHKVTGDVTQFVKKEMPKKLQILDEDDAATRDRKRKQIKVRGRGRAGDEV